MVDGAVFLLSMLKYTGTQRAKTINAKALYFFVPKAKHAGGTRQNNSNTLNVYNKLHSYQFTKR